MTKVILLVNAAPPLPDSASFPEDWPSVSIQAQLQGRHHAWRAGNAPQNRKKGPRNRNALRKTHSKKQVEPPSLLKEQESGFA